MMSIRALGLPLGAWLLSAGISFNAAAVTLEELDAQLQVLEARLVVSDVMPATRYARIAPVLALPQASGPEDCARAGSEMTQEKKSLVAALRKKRSTVDEIGALITKQRRSLFQNGCTDADRKQLERLRADLDSVVLDDDRHKGDALLDCVNQKIRASEFERDIAIENGASTAEQHGFRQRLDQMNRFSQQMIDLSIEIGSAANLHGRLVKSVKEFEVICEGSGW